MFEKIKILICIKIIVNWILVYDITVPDFGHSGCCYSINQDLHLPSAGLPAQPLLTKEADNQYSCLLFSELH